MLFELILKNDRIKLYNRFALFIFLLNAFGVILFAYKQWMGDNSSATTLVCALFAIAVLIFVLNTGAYSRKKYTYLFASISLSLFWVVLGFWWLGLLLVVLFIFYIFALQEKKVVFTTVNIVYPSFPKKTIRWDMLNNAILKDELLTIDFRSNKIIQQYIDPILSKVNERDFNDFCKTQLTR